MGECRPPIMLLDETLWKSHTMSSSSFNPSRYSTPLTRFPDMTPNLPQPPLLSMSSVTPEPREHKPVNSHGFGHQAPPRNLPFPPTPANLTAVELLTFLPHCIKCADVVYRFVSNGGTRYVFWAIVNTQRELEVEWNANSCGVQMYKAMRDAGYKDWTIKIHDRWHAAKKDTWDKNKLDVSGFHAPSQPARGGRSAKNVPFKSLAVDVRRMPEGDDALDLTRMVQYCVQNPDEQWMYPRDYEELLDLIGGPIKIMDKHTDRAAFGRWEGKSPPPRGKRPVKARDETIEGAVENRKRKRANSVRQELPFGSRRASATQTRTRERRKKSAIAYEEAAAAAAAAGTTDTKYESASNEKYVRQPPLYVEPPKDITEPLDAAIEATFLTEGSAYESNMFSAYAFGSFRTSPPYRMLYRITQPAPWDMSGWAENLRWAFEQRACFLHTFRTVGWNESPEHMELMAKIRSEQVWASDELLDHLAESESECIM